MTYKKTYKKKTKKYNKSKRYRRVSGEVIAANLGAKAYNLAKKALKSLNVEYKYADFDNSIVVTNAPTWANGNIFSISGVLQGTGESNRVGNQVEFKNFSIHGTLQQSAAATYQATRLIIFKHKSPQGGQPTVSEVLDASSGAPYINAHYNLDNVPQAIQILSDTKHTTNDNAPYKPFNINIEKDVKTRYLSTGGTYADVNTEGVYILILFNGSGYSQARISTRVRWVDN